MTIRALVAALSMLALGFAPPPTAMASPVTDAAGDLGVAATGDEAAFTYEVEQRGAVQADFDEFVATVTATLGDGRGWTRAGVAFEQVDSGGDFSLILASPDEVDAAHEVCSPQWSCRVGDQVFINDERWRTGTDTWAGSLTDYQHYVTNHEVGHWLGLGHYDCPDAGEPAPVMQQQSIDLQGCDPNGWPLDWEVEAVADLRGTTPEDPPDPVGELPGVARDGDWYLRADRSAGPADVEFRFGRSGDVPLAGDWNADGRRTPSVVRVRSWHLRNSTAGGEADLRFGYGTADDTPIAWR